MTSDVSNTPRPPAVFTKVDADPPTTKTSPKPTLAEEFHELNIAMSVQSVARHVGRELGQADSADQVETNQKEVALDTPLQRIGFRARMEQITKNLPADENGVISKEQFRESFAKLRRVPFKETGSEYDPLFVLQAPGMQGSFSDAELKETMFRGNLSEYAGALMDLADGHGNGDGQLTRDELLNFMLERDKQLRDMFRSIDTNNNGFIEPEEFVAALHDAGLRLASQDLVILWERMSDPMLFGHKDTQRRLNYEQFRHLLMLIPFQEASLRGIFQTLDAFQLSVSDLDMLPLPGGHFEGLSVQERRLYVLAGGLAGMLGRTLTAPMDRMRIYLVNETQEVFSGREAKANHAARSTLRATLDHFYRGVQILFRTRGLPEFWRGNFIECLRVFPATAAQFGTVEYVKGVFKLVEGTQTRADISHLARFIAGAVGGMASVAVTFPLGTIKVRMMSAVEGEHVAHEHHHSTPLDKCAQPKDAGKRAYSTLTRRGVNFMDPHGFRRYTTIDPNPTAEYRAWPAAKALYRREGVRGFYRGLGISLAGMAPFAGINYMLFEALKQNALKTQDITRVDSMKVFQYGLFSASLATAVCYPFQVVKTRMQSQGTAGHPERYSSTYACVRSLLKYEGWHGLFKGLGVTLGRTLPAAVIMRVAFEQNKTWLGLP